MPELELAIPAQGLSAGLCWALQSRGYRSGEDLREALEIPIFRKYSEMKMRQVDSLTKDADYLNHTHPG